jgi:DtxR family Mn-dependent transcriptional regulator
MYLKALAEYDGNEPATISHLAERLGVTNVSANEMIRRLDEQGLVRHTPYKGVALTEKGSLIACSVLRRQRLWECFLFDYLKIEWAKIYELACALEHATAPELTDALANFLGNPATCPRGNPIPSKNGILTPIKGLHLNLAEVGDTVEILAVNATATDVLVYLQERKIMPGSRLIILETAPMNGPLTLKVFPKDPNAGEVRLEVLGRTLAEFVIVKIVNSFGEN